jgi:ketosteroid isomerase-like protein
VYHFIVRQRTRMIFERLSRGDFDFVLAQFAPAAEHWFSGRHALGGRRRTSELRRAWYERLAAVLPGMRFDVHKIVSSGWPWLTHVAVEWTMHIFDQKGAELPPNAGMFMLTLRWGKVVELHVHCDTQIVAENLRLIASQGMKQAALPPIGDAAAA